MSDQNGTTEPERQGSGASLAPFEAGAHSLATPEDVAAFQERFFRLFERRAAIFTMGDSASVPTHVAVDLLQSVCFVLGIDFEYPEIPERLLSVDLEDEFRSCLADIERKVELAGDLWRDVAATMPPISNIALHDTLAELGDFPKHYDFRSMAHVIPVSIDYPLCHSVPETLPGVDYVVEYLRRLLMEADFLRRFDLGACVDVLEHSSPDYVGLLVNLYAPVATNAIGLALIGKDPGSLRISSEDRDKIVQRLGQLGDEQRSRAMREAALAVCERMGIGDASAVAYLCALVPELMPRIEVCLPREDLRGIFVG